MSGEADTFFFWPQWRFGAVMRAPARGGSARGLSVVQAKRLGELFEPKERVGQRYLRERPDRLSEFAAGAGGHFLGHYRAHISDEEAHLVRATDDRQISVAYRWVPIVAFPRYFVRLGDDSWLIRDGLTVCAAGSLSKLWMHGLLIEVDGKRTLHHGNDLQRLSAARTRFAPFARLGLDHLRTFYETALTEDVRTLPGIGAVPDLRDLSPAAEAEIVGLATAANIDRALEHASRLGLESLRSAQVDDPGFAAMRSFLEWTLSRRIDGADYTGTLVSIPITEDGGRRTHSLAISTRTRSLTDSDCDLYAALSQRHRAVQLPGGPYVGDEQEYMANQVATSHIAEEFGRFF